MHNTSNGRSLIRPPPAPVPRFRGLSVLMGLQDLTSIDLPVVLILVTVTMAVFSSASTVPTVLLLVHWDFMLIRSSIMMSCKVESTIGKESLH